MPPPPPPPPPASSQAGRRTKLPKRRHAGSRVGVDAQQHHSSPVRTLARVQVSPNYIPQEQRSRTGRDVTKCVLAAERAVSQRERSWSAGGRTRNVPEDVQDARRRSDSVGRRNTYDRQRRQTAATAARRRELAHWATTPVRGGSPDRSPRGVGMSGVDDYLLSELRLGDTSPRVRHCQERCFSRATTADIDASSRVRGSSPARSTGTRDTTFTPSHQSTPRDCARVSISPKRAKRPFPLSPPLAGYFKHSPTSPQVLPFKKRVLPDVVDLPQFPLSPDSGTDAPEAPPCTPRSC